MSSVFALGRDVDSRTAGRRIDRDTAVVEGGRRGKDPVTLGLMLQVGRPQK